MTSEQFNQYARLGYNRIPVCKEVLADLDTPLSAYLKLADGAYSYLFESVHGGEQWGRYSIIGLPCKTVVKVVGNRINLEKNGEMEKLTGYIEISLNSELDGGFLFFRNEQVLGGYYFWEKNFNGSKESRDLLLQKAKQTGGIFHVSKISPETKQVKETSKKKPSPEVVAALEELLALLESLFTSSRTVKGDFNTLMKKKFLTLTDEYAFLDPFAGEFQYSGGKIRVASEVTDAELAKGLMVAAAGLVGDHGLNSAFKGRVKSWLQDHQKKFLSLGFRVDSVLAVQ